MLLAAFVGVAIVLNDREEDLISEMLDEQLQSLMVQYWQGAGTKMALPQMQFYAFPSGADEAAYVPVIFRGAKPGQHEAFEEGIEYHYVVRDDKGVRFLLAYDVAQYEDSFEELLMILGVAFLLTLVVSVLMISWVTGKALANMESLAARLKQPTLQLLRHDDMEAEVMELAAALDEYRVQQSLLLAREREFSAHLSHEIRTPLSVVRAQAEIISLTDDSALRDRANSIIQQVDRMRHLMEQLLKLARNERRLVSERISLAAMIETVWNELESIGNSRARLDNKVEPAVVVTANPLLVELVLRNVMANARMHADGSLLIVRHEGGVLIMEDDNASDASGQTVLDAPEKGLGLSILERACQLLGWRCQLESRPSGTRVTITIQPASRLAWGQADNDCLSITNFSQLLHAHLSGSVSPCIHCWVRP
ncbi:MAG: sensor histidine kinase [Moraxellaceae bacterium]